MELLSTSEAAQRLQLSEIRVRQFCAERRIGQKVGKRWVISAAELDQFAKIPRFGGVKQPPKKRKK
jgi:excisionase family DNA binding protein